MVLLREEFIMIMSSKILIGTVLKQNFVNYLLMSLCVCMFVWESIHRGTTLHMSKDTWHR